MQVCNDLIERKMKNIGDSEKANEKEEKKSNTNKLLNSFV